MKELTIEQKAKAYDEAIEMAKKWRNAPNVDKIPTFANRVIDEIFPELCESEDEKVRKAIIELVKQSSEVLDKQNQSNMLTWLEKQDKHKKFRDSIQVGDEVTRNRDGVIVNLSQLNRVAKKGQPKLPIEKLPEEMKTIGESLGFTTQEECDEYNQIVSGLIMSDDNKEEQKQNVNNKKLTDVNHEYYSELLKNDRSDNIADYAYQCVYCMSHDWTIENPTWDNVQSACRLGAKWQKKHNVSEEWSEEDENTIKVLMNIIRKSEIIDSIIYTNSVKEKLYDWLKSLKERIGE